MSAIRDDQLPNVSAFMNDFWKRLVKPCYNPEDGDSYWNDVFVRVEMLSKKYCQEDKRLQKILAAFALSLDAVRKEQNGRTD